MTLFTNIIHIVTLTTQELKVITTLVKPITSDRSLPWYGCWVFYMMQRSKLSNSGGLTVDIMIHHEALLRYFSHVQATGSLGTISKPTANQK